MTKTLPPGSRTIKALVVAGICAWCTQSTPLGAQSLQQRLTIQQNSNTAELKSLQQKLSLKHNLREAAVQLYLQQHPEKERTFVRNGSLYYLHYIDEHGNPLYINTKNVESGKMIGVNQLYTGGSVGANVSGTGMVAGVWDGGQVRATHELLSGKVNMQPNQALNTQKGNDHMTHVSGTMVGKKLAHKPDVHGIAYDATARNYDWSEDQAEMTAFAGSGFLISNHSYGLSNDNTVPKWQFGAYDGEAREWDAITANAPFYLPFVAAGNEQSDNGNMEKMGYDLISGTSASKNVVTVGALNRDSTMSSYSNWGPTDDGRFKPDLVAKGTGINSSQSAADNAYSGTEGSDGTSYATPAAAATALLLQQYHHNLSGKYMRSATLKALLLHTAFDLGNPGPDYKFGWGLLDAEKAGMLIKSAYATNKNAVIREYETNPENTGRDDMITSFVAKGGEPLKISLAWLDDAGTAQTAEDKVDNDKGRLVYTFDMAATKNNTNIELRPWKPMGMNNRTQNAGVADKWFDDDHNNYKQIIINNPEPGATYNVAIRKSSASPATIRPVTLIVSGITSNDVLPVHIQSFTAAPAGVNNLVAWKTATEDLGTTFILQHSINGSTFVDKAVIKGNGYPSAYQFTDDKPLQPVTFYRLKIKEADGSIMFSGIEKVKRSIINTSITVAPVPANNLLTVTNTNELLNGTVATITDMMGRQVKRFVLKPNQQINISNFNPGAYIIKLQNGEMFKIIKQ